MQSHTLQHRIPLAVALLITLAYPLAAHANSELASDKGCYNCHGASAHAKAPSFERLARQLSKYQGDLAAEDKYVTKFLTGEIFNNIDAHEQLKPESAKALIHWLIEGGK